MKTKQKLDRRFLQEAVVFMALLYGITAFVYLNGDDFMYGAFAHTGLIANVTDYYFTGNGRFWINILDSALLWFDRYAFILVLPRIVLAVRSGAVCIDSYGFSQLGVLTIRQKLIGLSIKILT